MDRQRNLHQLQSLVRFYSIPPADSSKRTVNTSKAKMQASDTYINILPQACLYSATGHKKTGQTAMQAIQLPVDSIRMANGNDTIASAI